MTRDEKEREYRARGLVTEAGFDEPGTHYEPHRHERTLIYTVSGTLRLRLDDGPWLDLGPGGEQVVADGQLHEGVVGPQGWEYVVGTAAGHT